MPFGLKIAPIMFQKRISQGVMKLILLFLEFHGYMQRLKELLTISLFEKIINYFSKKQGLISEITIHINSFSVIVCQLKLKVPDMFIPDYILWECPLG